MDRYESDRRCSRRRRRLPVDGTRLRRQARRKAKVDDVAEGRADLDVVVDHLLVAGAQRPQAVEPGGQVLEAIETGLVGGGEKEQFPVGEQDTGDDAGCHHLTAGLVGHRALEPPFTLRHRRRKRRDGGTDDGADQSCETRPTPLPSSPP